MWASVIKFFASPFGGFVQKALIIIAIGGAIWAAVLAYNSHIADVQRMRDRDAQITQLVKDQNELRIKLGQVEQVNRDILIKLDKQNTKVVEKHTEVQTYLNSPNAQKNNRDASPIIKETIGMLSEK